MKLTSKFNANDSVWFFDHGQTKFFEGTINDVQYWDKWNGFRYDISHINPEGVQSNYNVEEDKIYASKNEILNTAFEENGTIDIPEPEVETPQE